ncbi:hypothetical protein P692DRAFT_20370643 [Suillus brevipes Sb2]|nr:hypothetical protein P692DRAFT_20370643 [Suillus brevipes Sb2]
MAFKTAPRYDGKESGKPRRISSLLSQNIIERRDCLQCFEMFGWLQITWFQNS